MKDPPPISKTPEKEADAYPRRQLIQQNIQHGPASFWGDSTVLSCSNAGHDLRDLHIDQLSGPANDFNQYQVPNVGFGPEETFTCDAQHIPTAPRFVDRNEISFPRVIEKYAEASRSDRQGLEGERRLTQTSLGYQYNAPPISLAHPGNTAADIMQSSPYLRSSSLQTESRLSQYRPFRGSFGGSEMAREYRKTATRFNRKPYRHPETDSSISEIENDRSFHVERIYNAMTRSDAARDNRGSIAMKRWVHSAYYDSDLVESHAHKILDCLLEQAKDGFRGWPHNDYVTDDRKGEDEDKDVSCAGRLDNIVRALEEEKTICEDVMNSACQIRMFVNAPKAYANRKYQNRVGNSKRGRPKDTVADSKAARRKATPRTRARASSSVSASVNASYSSPTPEPSLEQRTHYSTPPAQADPSFLQLPHAFMSTIGHSAPIQTPQTGYCVNPSAMSPPALPLSHAPYDPSNPSVPPVQQAPSNTPSIYSASFNPASVMPNDENAVPPLGAQHIEPSSHLSAYPTTSQGQSTDDSINDFIDWSGNIDPTLQNIDSSSNFEHVHFPAMHDDPGQGRSFQSLWEGQGGVQPFPFQGFSE